MIIPDIESLKKVVKINASIPFEGLEPYLNDAQDIYIEPQVGNAIIEKAKAREDQALIDKVVRVLGPLALALGTDELGIQFGDSGITVDNVQGKRSPASDAKIAAAKKNLFYRGMQALDRLLEYLASHPEQYPEYATHLESISSVPCFIRSAREFQDTGLVNIEYSTVTYRSMLPTIRQLQERHIREMLPPDLFLQLLANQELNAEATVLRTHVIAYLANKTAELYTSQSSHSERQNSKGMPEYNALIRPLYQDIAATGNFYASQSDYWKGKISSYLTEHSEELGIPPVRTAIDYNRKERKIFTSII